MISVFEVKKKKKHNQGSLYDNYQCQEGREKEKERLEAWGANKNWILNHVERLTGSWVWVLKSPPPQPLPFRKQVGRCTQSLQPAS